MKHKAGNTLRVVFRRGLAALLPTILTVWILKWVYNFFWNLSNTVNKFVLSPLVGFFSRDPDLARRASSTTTMNIVAFLVGLLTILVLGWLMMSLVGRRTWAILEKHLERVPIVRAIYPTIKQLTDFFLSHDQMEFRHACSVEYPRKGVWSLGFLTGPGLKSIEEKSGQRMLAVFLPSSPSPVTGYVVYFPADEVIHLPLTAEQMLRITVSGGVIPPLHEASGPVPTPPAGSTGEKAENIAIDSVQDSR